MILVYISIFIGISIAIYYTYNSWMDDIIDYILNSIVGAFLGFLIGMLIATILPMDTYNKHYSFKIENLQDNNSIGGRFFLGSGQIDGKMKYVFYYEKNGLYKMMQINYELVQIKYSDNNPKVNVTEICPSNSFINNFAIDVNIYDKTYIIEVPKGTIKNNYNLDAQ